MIHFPNSARARWMAGKNRPRTTTRPQPSQEAMEIRALAAAMAPLLPKATLMQLHQVAAILGWSPEKIRLFATETRHPGTVGKAVLEACR